MKPSKKVTHENRRFYVSSWNGFYCCSNYLLDWNRNTITILTLKGRNPKKLLKKMRL